MRPKNWLITFISVLLIAGATVAIFIGDETLSKVATVITVATAVIGAAALFFQFNRDKELNEASFLINYSTHFYDTYQCKDLMNELEKARVNPEYRIDTEKYYQDIVGYLEWTESLASLVNSGTISLRRIDDVLSYRFFLIVNNAQIQQRELIPCKEFYRATYKLYEKWSAYKRKANLPIVFEETELSKTDAYAEMIQGEKR